MDLALSRLRLRILGGWRDVEVEAVEKKRRAWEVNEMYVIYNN